MAVYIFNYLLYCNQWNSREYITTVRKSSTAQLYKASSLSAYIKEMSVPWLPSTRAAGSVVVFCKAGRGKSRGRTMVLLKPLRTEVCPYSSMLLHWVLIFPLEKHGGSETHYVNYQLLQSWANWQLSQRRTVSQYSFYWHKCCLASIPLKLSAFGNSVGQQCMAGDCTCSSVTCSPISDRR